MFVFLLQYNNITVQYGCLISWGLNFHRFLSMVIYEALYTWCLRYNICSTWFLDIKISTCCRLTLTSCTIMCLTLTSCIIALHCRDTILSSCLLLSWQSSSFFRHLIRFKSLCVDLYVPCVW